MKEELKKAKKSLKIAKDIFQAKHRSYNFVKMKDNGLHKDYHEKISFLKKELLVLERTFQYWISRVVFLENQTNKGKLESHG